MAYLDVRDMVRLFLRERGFEGLSSACGECACLLEDLAPCGSVRDDCCAGYKVDGCTDDCGMGCDFHIVEVEND